MNMANIAIGITEAPVNASLLDSAYTSDFICEILLWRWVRMGLAFGRARTEQI
ncbi:predicted protein [Sclerotinia sclerotiorum 1980 UF-70]|uniref:Uncharacterized protein n=1 Tax=Sclerotinia sclerotiorum (strain ATCC 18683 / 1980 / Ss-1) TaxID=665079 RepID=A7ENH6_SCLS1|nr:predicted protein [Sclerotinia sclerotiorum 1980 UF-70]EDO04392.1 predicted protein [Sclerotinia sclerotiorum 1980 UF-70]